MRTSEEWFEIERRAALTETFETKLAAAEAKLAETLADCALRAEEPKR
jgi:hypothetical protein